jgi:hypothetical protein
LDKEHGGKCVTSQFIGDISFRVLDAYYVQLIDRLILTDMAAFNECGYYMKFGHTHLEKNGGEVSGAEGVLPYNTAFLPFTPIRHLFVGHFVGYGLECYYKYMMLLIIMR